MKSQSSILLLLLLALSCQESKSPAPKQIGINTFTHDQAQHANPRFTPEYMLPHNDATFAAAEPISPLQVDYFHGNPEDIGTRYGTKHGATMQLLTRKWLFAHMLIASSPGPFRFQKNVNGLTENLPDVYRLEVEAMAQAADVDAKKALEANFASDLLQMALRPFGCSTYVVMPQRSATGAMIYGRNLDYFGSNILREHWTPIVFHRPGFKKVLSISVPGHSGIMTGINEDGVMMSIMVSFSDVDYRPEGLASLFVFRSVLERASTAKEAQQLYVQVSRTVPVNVMIADGRDAIVVEADVERFTLRTPSPAGTLYAANHFEDPELQARKHGRDKRWPLLAQFDQSTDKIGLSEVKKVLAEAAAANPAFIAQNILGVVVDFGRKEIIFGSDEPIAINGRLRVIKYQELFDALGR